MSYQPRLPGITPPGTIDPDTEIEHPVIWVRRVQVRERLAPDGALVIRDVSLRRGLNIVWSEPGPLKDNRLFDSAVTGHTAGKTTFCRFLRYLLGEDSFGDEAARARIRRGLPEGWVLGEIFVDGQLWSVARPLGLGRRSYTVRGMILESLLDQEHRLDFAEFQAAVSETIVPRLAVHSFPSRPAGIDWNHILPWLSRDQECRFADPFTWRDSSSSSEAPALTSDERHFVVRAVLGLIKEAERAQQAKHDGLLSSRQIVLDRIPLLEHQARVEHRRLNVGMGAADPVDWTAGPMAYAAVDRYRLQREDETRAKHAEWQRGEGRLGHQQDALERAVSEAAALSERRRQKVLEIQKLDEAIQEVEAGTEGERLRELVANLPGDRPRCDVPLHVAREHCPLMSDDVVDFTGRRLEKSFEDTLRELGTRRALLEKELETLVRVERHADEDVQTARARYLTARNQLLKEGQDLTRVELELQAQRRSLDNAREASEELLSLRESANALQVEIKESLERQAEIRSDVERKIGSFSAIFDYAVRALIGDEVSAQVRLSGRSLSLEAAQNGERDSAALSTVKLLAFDLAALVASVQGHCEFPRFLVHDCPREADMSLEIYERLFLLARQLEECFEREPTFQYIITTTTPPPTQFATQPWLRLSLAGAPAEQRLLGRDL